MFKIIKKSKLSQARLGLIKTGRGEIATPVFLPDATRAAVKFLGASDLEKLGLPVLVVNTLHLYLEPGLEVIKKAGGVNKFMNFNGPILSDSGGYQVFSLIHKNNKMGKISDQGAEFKSPLTGTKHTLTPEKSMQIQFALGSDMMVVLDDCPPNDYHKADIRVAVARTIKWAKRSKQEFAKQIKKRKITSLKPLLFGVIQGGQSKELRKKCAEALIKIGFSGYGFGARPVDAKGKFLQAILSYTAQLIPENSIRFGLGIGTPADIIRSVQMGWDMFDCVIPTREGRHGRIYRFKNSDLRFKNDFYEIINITNAKYKKDFSLINKDSKLPDLRNLSKAYLHHLFKVNEPLGQRLATLNNLEFYLDLMVKIRYAIGNDLM